ncbi:hypothetical protein HQ587_10170 [bacterium]|nr:hypothetical protein [bacterium]
MNRLTGFILTIIIVMIAGCAQRTDNPPVGPTVYQLRLVSETQTPGWAKDLYVHEDMVFLADDDYGVTIWDIEDIESPYLITTIQTNTNAMHITYSEQSRMLFIAGRNGTYGYSIDSLTTQGEDIYDLMFLSEYGVSAIEVYDLTEDLIILAVTDPWEVLSVYKAFRWPITSVDAGFWNSDNNEFLRDLGYSGLYMDIPNNLMYMAKGQLGLDIVEINYESVLNLNVLGSIDTYGSARDVTLNRDKSHAIVADYNGCIQIIDIKTDESNPVVTGELRIKDVADVETIVAIGDTVYFIDKFDGLFVVDVSELAAPVLIAEYDAPAPTGLFVLEDHTVFIADQDLGLIILKWQ